MNKNNKIYLSFLTASILNWYPILKDDSYKDIIINSLRYLKKEKKIKVSAFVIMPTHIHLIWKINSEFNREDIRRDFFKFTAISIKKFISDNNSALLTKFYVGVKDRKFQIWQRNPLNIELYSENAVQQKVNYIHYNPVKEKWNLAIVPQDYKYSSAKFYMEGIKDWDFLEHYNEIR